MRCCRRTGSAACRRRTAGRRSRPPPARAAAGAAPRARPRRRRRRAGAAGGGCRRGAGGGSARLAAAEFGLDGLDEAVLLLALRCVADAPLDGFADAVLDRLRDPAAAVAALLGAEPREARRPPRARRALDRVGPAGADDGPLQPVRPRLRRGALVLASSLPRATERRWKAGTPGSPRCSAARARRNSTGRTSPTSPSPWRSRCGCCEARRCRARRA
jgi:hypothetical protein